MPPKVLIVDDEAHIRLLIEQTLEDLDDENVEFFSANNGADALATILSEQPDLVLLDIMMPKMNGFDVCHAVKKEHNLKSVKIILLTAKGQEADRQRGLEVGADMYLTKPFDPDQLLDLVRGFLEL
jgi:two-component system, OmpR family, alkaline phosphatase synthesis response regulator PhoP